MFRHHWAEADNEAAFPWTDFMYFRPDEVQFTVLGVQAHCDKT